MAVVCAAIIVAPWVDACGPSVQLIYEGNLRFEHCYRLDLDEHIALSHRLMCWSEWAKYYAKGQTRDRVDYAKRRIDALRGGDRVFQPLRLDDATDAGTSPVVAAAPAPQPTNVHAPPPALLQAPAAPSASAPPGSNTVEPAPESTATKPSVRSPVRRKGQKAPQQATKR